MNHTSTHRPLQSTSGFSNGAILSASVEQVGGNLVKLRLDDSEVMAWLHVSQLGGGTRAARRRRLSQLEVHDSLTVEITAVSVDGITISVSEKKLQTEWIAQHLKVGSKCRTQIVHINENGAFAQILDGPAKGTDGLIHSRHLPEGNGGTVGSYVECRVVGSWIKDGDARISLKPLGEQSPRGRNS